jgi:PAS domain S-box-containing protein
MRRPGDWLRRIDTYKIRRVAVVSPPGASPPDLPLNSAPQPPARILLVDDCDADLLAIETVLAELGEPVVRARSGQEALRILLESDFAMVLLDVRLGDISGFEVARLIRDRRRLKHLPIVFITGIDPEGSEVDRAYGLGAVDFITKPIAAPALLSKARVFVELHRSRTQLARRVEERTAELERAIESLKTGEVLISATLEQMPLGVGVLDPSGRWIVSNAVMRSFVPERIPSGDSHERSRWRVFRGDGTLVPPDEWPSARALRGERVSPGMEMIYTTAGGREIWTRVSSVPLRGSRGDVIGAVCTLEDIDASKRAQTSLQFLAEASRLLASSLDFDQTLRNVARLAVPKIADWCVVELVEEDKTIRRVALHHPDPAKVARAEAFRRARPVSLADENGTGRVLSTGTTEFTPWIPDLAAQAGSWHPEDAALIRDLDFRSVIIVPLKARGRTLGAVTLIHAESSRRYEPADVQMAEDLAQRVAVALDNAWLYRERTRSEEELRVIMESVPAAILITKDAEGRTIVGNSLSYEMMEMSPGQNISKSAPEGEASTPYDIYIDGRRARPEELPIQRAAATGVAIFGRELQLRFPDGRTRWIYGNSVPLFNPEGKVRQVVAAFVDVTERRRAEEKLRESQERLRFLAEASSVIFSTLGYEERLESMARLAVPRVADGCSIHLLDENRAPRRAAVAHRDPERAREFGLAVDRFPLASDAPFGIPYVLRTGEAQLLPELTDDQIRRLGPGPEAMALFWSQGVRSLMCVPLRARDKLMGALVLVTTESGRLFGPEDVVFAQEFADRAAISIDNARLYQSVVEFNRILELRVEERTAELREALRELDSFAYSVAHDLRAPLRAMTSFSQILLEDAKGKLGPDELEFPARIAQAAQSMDRMVQDLLAYCHVARQDFPLETVDLDHVVHELVVQLADELQSLGATVEVATPLPRVKAHRVGLSQALTNLIENAAKYVSPGIRPKITLRAERSAERIRVWVEDNGIGIAPEYHDKIFGLFQRLHSSEKYPGTGIGLAIARKAMEKMGGACGVESAPGNGSRFWIEMESPEETRRLAQAGSSRRSEATPGNG